MRDSLELFSKTVEEYSEVKNVQNALLELLESLYKDLDYERKSNAKLQKQVEIWMKGEQFGITSKFVALKAQVESHKAEITLLKNENDDLNIQLIAKSEEMKHKLVDQAETLKAHHVLELNRKDDELKLKDLQISSLDRQLKCKDHELYSEIQAVQATLAIQTDQVKEQYKKQLDDANNKLKDNMATCSNLRIQLISVKEQLCEQKNEFSRKITELKKRLHENQTGARPSENAIDFSSDTHETSFSKYQPLDISCKKFAAVGQEAPINLKKPPVYRGSGNYMTQFSKRYAKKAEVAATIELQEEPSKDKPRKRKLYNPDDLSYLSSDNAGN